MSSVHFNYRVMGFEKPVIMVETESGETICKEDECSITHDLKAAQLYDAALKTFDFFDEVFDWKGTNGKGHIAQFVAHWKEENAAWDCGTSRCKLKFNDKFVTLKVVAHEWTHASVDSLARLNYSQESGALSEGLADIMGIACNAWSFALDLKDRASWKIVDRDLTVPVQRIRMLRPNELPSKSNDYGYVHENSRVISRAYHFAVTVFILAVEKKRIEKDDLDSENFTRFVLEMTLSPIWEAMGNMRPDETFKRFAAKVIHFADRKDWWLGGIFKESYIQVGILKREIPKEPAMEKTKKRYYLTQA